MIDAAGAIYVIGGEGGNDSIFYNDVWVSTDGGARPDSVRGVHLVGTQRVRRGTQGVLRGSLGYPRGLHQADPPKHAFRTIARVAFPRSQDM